MANAIYAATTPSHRSWSSAFATLQSAHHNSMQHQTVQQFLWIIRTDPALDDAIKQELIAAVSQQQPNGPNNNNVVLIASTKNPEGFRAAWCIADITVDTVWAGSLALVRSYYEAAAPRMVLETRCDADDAEATDFVELPHLRRTAILLLLASITRTKNLIILFL